MPGKRLPEHLKDNLPEHAQHIYSEAYNNAYDQYAKPEKRKRGGSREEASNRVAWAAVKKKYEKGSDGKWHKK